MNIRLGTKEDVEEVGVYLKEMWLMHSEEEPDFVSREVIEKYDSATIENYLKDCFKTGGKSSLLIAEENGEITGFLKVNAEKIQKFFKQTKVLYLDDLYVKEKYRGKGVAKVLIKEAESIAKKKKIRWLKARIYIFNKAAQKLAEKVELKPLYSEYFKILD